MITVVCDNCGNEVIEEDSVDLCISRNDREPEELNFCSETCMAKWMVLKAKSLGAYE